MDSLPRPRLLKGRQFPAYAYLPGTGQPHPVRDSGGHSHFSEIASRARKPRGPGDDLQWGIDLFNHGYYWEAHEAWEPLWLGAKGNVQDRALFKGLIMLAATGVKIREGKRVAALRHAGRASKSLCKLDPDTNAHLLGEIGIAPDKLARLAEAAAGSSFERPRRDVGQAEPVFSFILGPNCYGRQSALEEI